MKNRSPVFECRRCGQCCQGKGGIRLDGGGLAEAALCLSLDPEVFKSRYLDPDGPPWEVLTGPDGFCRLNRQGLCLIHGAWPPMCRDWPFFHGPINSEAAFRAARSACPGLDPAASWDDFKTAWLAKGRPMPPLRYL